METKRRRRYQPAYRGRPLKLHKKSLAQLAVIARYVEAASFADLKFSTATLGAALDGTELLGMTQGGNDRSLTSRMIAAYVGEGLGNQSIANQACPAASTTYLTNSNNIVPTGERVKVGTVFRWHGTMTKTAAGTAANSILVKIGTAGTSADATILTFTLPAGTAAADTGYFEINVVVRVIGASAVINGTCLVTHNLATTGIININQVVLNVTSSTFNSNVDLLNWGLAFTSGTSVAWTFTQIFSTIKNL